MSYDNQINDESYINSQHFSLAADEDQFIEEVEAIISNII